MKPELIKSIAELLSLRNYLLLYKLFIKISSASEQQNPRRQPSDGRQITAITVPRILMPQMAKLHPLPPRLLTSEAFTEQIPLQDVEQSSQPSRSHTLPCVPNLAANIPANGSLMLL